MNLFLQNPYGLLALLSLPAILGIYWFRRRHQIQKISGLFLWDEPIRSMQGGTQLHRPPPSRSLFLDLLCALLISLAIASPAILRQYNIATVYIFDNSLSMRANNNFERAKEIARKIEGTTGTVIFAADNPQVVLPPSTSTSAISDAIAKYDPYLGQSELQKAVDLARELQPGKLRMHLFTDSEIMPSAPAQTELVVHTFNGQGANPAILKAARNSDASRQILSLSIGGLETAPAQLSLSDGAKVIHSEKLAQTASIVHLSLELPKSTQDVMVRLAAPVDVIKADSVATLLRPPVRTPGFNIDLNDKKLAAAAQRALFACGAHEGTDLLVTDKNISKGGVFTLYIPPAKKDVPTYTGPYIIDLANMLCRDLSLDGVYWTVAQERKLSDISGALVMAGDVPLYWQESEDRAVLNINFELGNIARVPAWPVLFVNLCQKSAALLPGFAVANYACAKPLEYIPAQNLPIAEECFFENVSSKEKRLINGTLRNAVTPQKPGRYQVFNGTQSVGEICVNPLFLAESDTSMLAQTDSEETITPKTGTGLMRQPFNLNRILAALGLLVFLLNSYLNKRAQLAQL